MTKKNKFKTDSNGHTYFLCPHCEKYYGPFWGICKKCGESIVSWKIKGVALSGILIVLGFFIFCTVYWFIERNAWAEDLENLPTIYAE